MSAVIARRPQRTYTAAPAGTHHAVCIDVQNLGLVQSAWGQKHKVRIVWQIALIDDTHKRRFELARLYTLSLGERAALRADLERWRGKKFTNEELDGGFDLEKLIGVNCQLLVTHDLGDDGTTYANVTSVLPPGKGLVKLFPLEFTRLRDRQASRGPAVPATELDEDPVPF